MSGGGKSGDITVGYRYHLGMHMALCHGPVDKVTEIQVDGRVAWTGDNEGTSITVSADNLFGGDKREGGVSGTVDMEFGGVGQAANDYLSEVLPGANPAYRGVACAVLRQCYMGNNPYLKPWSFKAARIYTTDRGADQWNPSVAAIGQTETLSNCLPPCQRLKDWGGNAEHYWPCDNDPSVDGFLEGSVVNLTPATSNFTLINSPLLSADCPDAPHWRAVDAANTLEMDANDGVIISGPNLNMFKVWKREGTGTTRIIFTFVMTWLRDTGVVVSTLSITMRAVGSDLTVSWLSDGQYVEESGTIEAVGAIENPSTVASVLGLSFSGLPASWPATVEPNSRSGTLTLYVNGSAVTSGEVKVATGAAAGGETFTYDPTRFIGDAHTDSNACRFSDIVINGDITQYIDLFESDCSPVCADMNPAHIIRECLTQSWGLGYQDADIDDTSFESAADALFTEQIGMSILWDKELPLEDFIAEILRHIDAVLYVSRETGKFVLKLIRDDYDAGSLVTLDETNSRMASDARRPALGELTTSVTVGFTDSEQDEEEGSVTVHNEALIQLQGSVSNAKVDYPGFMTRAIASRVALRDLKSLSTPLLSCDVEATRAAASLNIGDVFILDYPEQGISNLVMRIESMSVGDGRDNTVKISCIEDAFSVPDFAAVGDVGQGWVDPVAGTPLESEPRLMIESPYYELVQRVGDREATTILTDDPDAGFLYANGGRQGNELNADLLVDSGAGYVDSGTLDFAPYAYLTLDAWYSDPKLYYTGGKDLDLVTFPALAQIGQEIVRVDSIGVDSNGSYMAVGRGVLDTVPAEHTVESPDVPIVFFSPETDNAQYTASDSVNVKLLTALGSQRLTDATADTVIFDSRAIRPYPPGNLEIDLESYPRNKIWDGMHSLSWAHRDRLQQTSGTIFDYTEGDIGPEAGTTYRVTVDAILTGGGISADFIDVDVGSATDWEQDSNTDSNVGPPPEDSDYIRFKVTSYRDGYASWQPAMVVIPFAEEVDSIGFDSAPDSAPTDPIFANVALLLHMDGADASTTFTDSSSSALTVTAVGNAQIDTAQFKFGGASGLFDGSGDYLTFSNTTDFKFLSDGADFTFECWIRLPSLGAGRLIFDNGGVATARRGFAVAISSGNKLQAFIARGTSGTYAASLTGPTSVSADTWHHVAAVADGGTLEIFLDGVSEGSAAISSPSALATSDTPNIGRYVFGNSFFFNGHIDDLRITNGVARYTAAFTPPTAPFPDE